MSQPRSRRIFLRLVVLGMSAGALLGPRTVFAAPGTPTPAPTRPPATPTPRPTQPPSSPTPRATQPPVRPSPTPSPVVQTSPAPAWLQALRPLTLWSGPDDAGEPLGTAARWDYFTIARPQVGGRIYV